MSLKVTESITKNLCKKGETTGWHAIDQKGSRNEATDVPRTLPRIEQCCSSPSTLSITAGDLFKFPSTNEWHSSKTLLLQSSARYSSKKHGEAVKYMSWERWWPRFQLRGSWKDTAKCIAALARNSLRFSCIRATSLAFTSVEQEHMRAIVQELETDEDITDKETTGGAILYKLFKRLYSNDWTVTLKAQGIMHYIVRHGFKPIIEHMVHKRRKVFRTEFYSDITSQGVIHNAFITCYGAYLEQLLVMRYSMNFPPSERSDGDCSESIMFQQASISELITIMPAIMDTLDVLIQIPFHGPTSETPVAAISMSLIISDINVLSHAFCNGLCRLIDVRFGENRDLGAAAYKFYARCVDVLSDLGLLCGTFGELRLGSKVPELRFVRTRLTEFMQEHVKKGTAQNDCETYNNLASDARLLNKGCENRESRTDLERLHVYEKGNVPTEASGPPRTNSVSGGIEKIAFSILDTVRWTSGVFVYEGLNSVYHPDIRVRENFIAASRRKLENVKVDLSKDYWKSVCIKATSNQLAPPKRKHVASIVQALRWWGNISSPETTVGCIFHHLKQRMYTLDYRILLKAQTIFHHIFREGDEALVAHIAERRRQMFGTELFADKARNDVFQDTLVKPYGLYLEQRLAMMAKIHFPSPPCDESDAALRTSFTAESAESIRHSLPILMETTKALITIPIDSLMAHTPVASAAVSMLFSDFALFLNAMFRSVTRLLDTQMQAPRCTSQLASKLYARFTQLLCDLWPFLAVMQARTVGCRVPTLDSMCLQLGGKIREHVRKPCRNNGNCEIHVANDMRALLQRMTSNRSADARSEGQSNGAYGNSSERIRRKRELSGIDRLFLSESRGGLTSDGVKTRRIKIREYWDEVVAMTQKDGWDYVVLRGTRGWGRGPESKYLRSIMLGVMWGGRAPSRTSATGAILYHLRERMRSGQWIVVVRTLTLVHYMLRGDRRTFWEGFGEEWIEELEMEGVEERMRGEGVTHVGFIRAYAGFVREWLKMRCVLEDANGKLGCDGEERRGEIVVKGLASVLDTIEAVLRVGDAGKGRGEWEVAAGARVMLRKDLDKLWNLALRGVEWIVEGFGEVGIGEEMVGLEIYKRVVGMAGEVRRVANAMKEDGPGGG